MIQWKKMIFSSSRRALIGRTDRSGFKISSDMKDIGLTNSDENQKFGRKTD
jgi:hypothetical protein